MVEIFVFRIVEHHTKIIKQQKLFILQSVNISTIFHTKISTNEKLQNNKFTNVFHNASLHLFVQVNVPSAMDSVAKQQRDVQRRQRAREQLLRVNQRKKEEKIAEQTSRLTALTQQLEAQSTFDPEEYQLMLEDIGFTTVEELRKEVASVRGSVEAEQEKLASVVKSLSGGGGVAGGGVASGGVEEEEEVSEEWLDSLRERKKVIDQW